MRKADIWQLARHIKLYSGLPQALNKEPLIALRSLQRGPWLLHPRLKTGGGGGVGGGVNRSVLVHVDAYSLELFHRTLAEFWRTLLICLFIIIFFFDK